MWRCPLLRDVHLEHGDGRVELVDQVRGPDGGVEHEVPRAFARREPRGPLGHQHARLRVYPVREHLIEPQVHHEVHEARVGFGDAAVRVRPSLPKLPVLLPGWLDAIDVIRPRLLQHRPRVPNSLDFRPAVLSELEHGHPGVPVVDGHHPLATRVEVEVAGGPPASLDPRLLDQPEVGRHPQGDDLPLVVDALGGGVEDGGVGR
mmetsp:Transcript_11218/g.45228  ORF Transcript_11218/g.45228 Transcript_11218/m.45228 type:complete len:204 (+) Transcript_11218:679-1290(+)